MLETARKHVEDLLNSYPEMIRKISLLRYELEHTSTVSPDEMIEAMSFAKSEGSGSAPSGVSNKTLYIALNYQEAAERVNTEAMDDLSLRLFPLEQTIHRLHHYVGLLPAEEKTIIQLSCFEQKSLQEVAEILDISLWTVRSRRKSAITNLAKMYDFVLEGAQ